MAEEEGMMEGEAVGTVIGTEGTGLTAIVGWAEDEGEGEGSARNIS
jgi:hypothetical protein